MTRKPDRVLWHGFHPDTTNIGLRVVQRPTGELYGEEVDLTVTDPATDPVAASIPIRHVAARAIIDMAAKIEEMKKQTNPPGNTNL